MTKQKLEAIPENMIEQLFSWQQNVIQNLQHMSTVPDDGTLQVEVIDDETKEIKLVTIEGLIHVGFLAGLASAINLVNTFPIKGLSEEGVEKLNKIHEQTKH